MEIFIKRDNFNLNLIVNPMYEWCNDDLLFKKDMRDFIFAQHPRLSPILDWPELRSRFAAFDAAAGQARRGSRQTGIVAGALGFVSLLIVAVLPLSAFVALPTKALGVSAAILALVSTIWGYWQILKGDRKAMWLTNRYWTERLRQLYFQFIINNLPLAARAMHDPAALAEWHALRAAALARFDHHHVGSATSSILQMKDDDAEEAFWHDHGWNERMIAPPDLPELDELFFVLDMQRFKIQLRYAALKTAAGAYSSKSRSFAVRLLSDILTLVALASVVIGGIALLFNHKPDQLLVLTSAAIAALCSATILFLRVLNEGLQLSSEAERYTWYRAAVASLERRYEQAGRLERIDILRDMERLSYQEMRWFIISFQEARFIL
jgi:hypothetical protein